MGTITWINSKDELPKHGPMSNKNGIWVLGYFGKNTVPTAIFFWWDNGFETTPTYWTYINEPE